MKTADTTLFDKLAGTWWDENTYFHMLRTMVNPWRLTYLAGIIKNLGLEPSNARLLDVGCGGGLLSEELHLMGFDVTGIDPSKESIAVARNHALRQGLRIDYQIASAEALPFANAAFDVVTCCDVLEHVPRWQAAVQEISRVLKPAGLFFYDTINRTAASRLVFVEVVQNWALTRIAPKHLHVWEMFITPRELARYLEHVNLRNQGVQGARFGKNAIQAFFLILQHRKGRITAARLGEMLQLMATRSLALSYAGFATKHDGGKGA